MAMIEQNDNIGGYGAGFGSNMLWWILIVIFVFLFVFRRDGERDGHGNGNGYGYGSYCHPKPLVPADCCEVMKGNYETQKVEVDQAEKTRALIELNYREQANRDFYKSQLETVELKNKINLLEGEKFAERRFDMVNATLGRIMCDLEKMPKPQPCYLPTVQACAVGCPPFRCGEEPRRGGCGFDCDR
jgi:hypothetical protein